MKDTASLKSAFYPISSADSRILILGSMPGERSLLLNQYYGHPGNQFWKLMFDVLGEPFSVNYNERVALLLRHKIALWDVLSHCEREGSADTAIRNAIPNDFPGFYARHPHISQVFFDSLTAKKLYDRLVKRTDGFHYSLLPSPSGAYAAKSYADKLKEWNIILKALAV